MSSALSSSHTQHLVNCLVNSMQDKGWALLAMSSITGKRTILNSSDGITAIVSHLADLDVAILDFAQDPNGICEQVRFDSQAMARDAIYGWTGEGRPGFGALVSDFVASIPSLMLELEPDQELDPESLRLKYEAAGEHPTHSKKDWQFEVAAEDTLRGYWDWVSSMLEEEGVLSSETNASGSHSSPTLGFEHHG